MGNSLSFLKAQEYKVIITGLYAAGKTQILYKQLLHQNETVIMPTLGFNFETLKISGIHLQLWDLGGTDKIHELHHHYFEGTHGLIFVIDSSNRTRLAEAKDELYNKVLNFRQLNNTPLLVFCNKQDLPNALSQQGIYDALQLDAQLGQRQLHVQPCSAESGDGIQDGIHWLVKQLRH